MNFLQITFKIHTEIYCKIFFFYIINQNFFKIFKKFNFFYFIINVVIEFNYLFNNF